MELTTLGAVQNWLFPAGQSVNTDDQLLTRLIAQCSAAARNYMQRPLLTRQNYTELRSGVGNQVMMLRNWPVVKVNSLVINNTTIPAAPAMQAGTPGSTYSPSAQQSGWTLQTWDGTSAGLPQNLTVAGYCFQRGQNNVQINYDAGYCVTAQTLAVPAISPYAKTVTPLFGSWSQDDGVIYAASGSALTAITSGAPAVGQYLVTPDYNNGSGTAQYVFKAGDANANLQLSYSYIPADVEQAVIELVGERYSYKQRIGQRSMSVGGQTTASYNLDAFPMWIQNMLDQYKKWLPF